MGAISIIVGLAVAVGVVGVVAVAVAVGVVGVVAERIRNGNHMMLVTLKGHDIENP